MISEEAWRIVPPEEKFEILAKSHASGVQAAFALTLLGATMAISFQSPFIFWSTLIASPIVFQFSSSRKWRSLRPRALLEYLAARSVTRRYAYAVKSVDLNLSLLFRGTLTHMLEDESGEGGLGTPHGVKDIPVWIALFPDAVVIISEKQGGAYLEFGHVINKRFTMETFSPADEEYSQNLTLKISYDDITFGVHTIKLESKYPAAINAFAKKTQEIIDTPMPERVAFDAEEFTADIMGAVEI